VHKQLAYSLEMGGEGTAGWELGGRKSSTTVPLVFLENMAVFLSQNFIPSITV
jgi:hypothetical protein